MRKVYIKGYINFNNDGYTFIYEDKKLTLISVKNKQSFFNEYKYVEFFEGFTLDGFDIVFYISRCLKLSFFSSQRIRITFHPKVGTYPNICFLFSSLYPIKISLLASDSTFKASLAVSFFWNSILATCFPSAYNNRYQISTKVLPQHMDIRFSSALR